MSAIFLEKISAGKIGTANPQFFDSVIRLDLADIHSSVKVQIGKGNIQFEIMELCYSDKRAGKRASFHP